MTAAIDKPGTIIQRKKYVRGEKHVTECGAEHTLYVTAIDGVVKEYSFKVISRPDLDKKGCKNQHLGTLQQFEKFWVNKKGFAEC